MFNCKTTEFSRKKPKGDKEEWKKKRREVMK